MLRDSVVPLAPSPPQLHRQRTAPSHVNQKGIRGVRRTESRNTRTTLETGMLKGISNDVSYVSELITRPSTVSGSIQLPQIRSITPAAAVLPSSGSPTRSPRIVAEHRESAPHQGPSLRESLATKASEVCGAPIESPIPMEYYVYDIQPAPWNEEGVVRKVLFPSKKPTSRAEVYSLAEAMDKMVAVVRETHHNEEKEHQSNDFERQGRRSRDYLCVVDIIFAELVRQTMAGCVERGLLLQHVRECVFSSIHDLWGEAAEGDQIVADMKAQVLDLKDEIKTLQGAVEEVEDQYREALKRLRREEKLKVHESIQRSRDVLKTHVEEYEKEEAAFNKAIVDARAKVENVRRSSSVSAEPGLFLSTKMLARNEDTARKVRERLEHPKEKIDVWTDTADLEMYGLELFGKEARMQAKREQAAADTAARMTEATVQSRGQFSPPRCLSPSSAQAPPGQEVSESMGASGILPASGLPPLEINPEFHFGASFSQSVASPQNAPALISPTSNNSQTDASSRKTSEAVLQQLRTSMSLAGRGSVSGSRTSIGAKRDAEVQAAPSTKNRETQAFYRKVKLRDFGAQAVTLTEGGSPHLKPRTREMESQTEADVAANSTYDTLRSEEESDAPSEHETPIEVPLLRKTSEDNEDEGERSVVSDWGVSSLNRVSSDGKMNDEAVQVVTVEKPAAATACIQTDLSCFTSRRLSQSLGVSGKQDSSMLPTFTPVIDITTSDAPHPPVITKPLTPAILSPQAPRDLLERSAISPTQRKTNLDSAASASLSPSTSTARVPSFLNRSPSSHPAVSPDEQLQPIEVIWPRLDLKKAKTRAPRWVIGNAMDIHAFILKEATAGHSDLQALTIQFFRNKYGLEKMSDTYIVDFLINGRKVSATSVRLRTFARFTRLETVFSVETDPQFKADMVLYNFYQTLFAHFRRQASRSQMQAVVIGPVQVRRDFLISMTERVLGRHLTPEILQWLLLATAETCAAARESDLGDPLSMELGLLHVDGDRDAEAIAESAVLKQLAAEKRLQLESSGNGRGDGFLSFSDMDGSMRSPHNRRGSEIDTLDLDSFFYVLLKNYRRVLLPLFNETASLTGDPELADPNWHLR